MIFKNIKILFVAGFGPVVRNYEQSRKLYADVFGIPFQEFENGYMFTDTGALDGVKHFALWPLSQAAQSCFGKDIWPTDVTIPQAWIEFDVEDIEKATAEMKSLGYRLLVSARKEPWGQTVTRFIDPEGLLVGITHTPSLREKAG
jgi:catechol 2,3-dioxygenase-like lactoylglutathione lyase family enzyme